MPEYILDACAVLAFLDGEEGAVVVRDLLDQAKSNEITLTMNTVNLIEVYYDRIRVVGTKQADAVIYDLSPFDNLTVLCDNSIRGEKYGKRCLHGKRKNVHCR